MAEFIHHDCYGTSCKITEGVIDANAKHLFTSGQCHALAMSLAKQLGCEVAVISWVAVQGEETLAEDRDIHVVARLPDGRFMDINGVHSLAEIEAQYMEPEREGIDQYVEIEAMEYAELMDYLNSNPDYLSWANPATDAADSIAQALSARLDLPISRPVLEGYRTASEASYARAVTRENIRAGLL